MRVEVLDGVERRRRWSSDEKTRLVEETLVPGAKVSEVARRNGISASLLFTWRRQARAIEAPAVAEPTLPSQGATFFLSRPRHIPPAGASNAMSRPCQVACPIS